MTARLGRLLVVCLVMPLCGFSCGMPFRAFQVRPYLADPATRQLTLAVLVENYREVRAAVEAWAAKEGLTQGVCRYHAYNSKTNVDSGGTSPACQVFNGPQYRLQMMFQPHRNSTSIQVSSNEHRIAQKAAQNLEASLAARFGANAIGEHSGGERGNQSGT